MDGSSGFNLALVIWQGVESSRGLEAMLHDRRPQAFDRLY